MDFSQFIIRKKKGKTKSITKNQRHAGSIQSMLHEQEWIKREKPLEKAWKQSKKKKVLKVIHTEVKYCSQGTGKKRIDSKHFIEGL